MELIPYDDDDLWLSETLETNPSVMSELGGPRPIEDIRAAHRKRVEGNATDPWWFKIAIEPNGEIAGMIGIWRSEWEGAPMDETGWSLRPAFQGRGLASAALGVLIDRARATGRFEEVHAFPGVTNGPSNGLCRKFGFELVAGDLAASFSGKPLTVNHWRLTLEREPG